MASSPVFSRRARPPAGPRAVVVGAGIGGLVAALLMAHRGLDVTVVDKAATPGGKLRQAIVGASAIDCGPTVLTMREVFEAVFADVGTSLAAHLDLVPAAILARHAWQAGGHLDLHADIAHAAEAIGRFAGAAEARGYLGFCRQAGEIYRLLDGPFIRSDRPSLPRLVGSLRGLDALRLSPFSTMWRALGTHFRDPRLRQLFGRYATYCGSSPYACPATLMLVAHVEQSGVWLVEGGLHRIARVLAGLATARGVTFRYGEEARAIRIERGRAAGIELVTGERIDADAVVCNADVGALSSGLLGAGARAAVPVQKPTARSLSAVTFALKATTQGFPLIRHNVFFSRDYAAEFDDVFGKARLPRDPTVYICAQDRDAAEGSVAAVGAPERLFCIVNAPANGDTAPFDDLEIARCEARTFQTLERCGLRVERDPSLLQATTPRDFDRLFPGTGGALYGMASHGWTASFRRPGARSRVPGLYLCGGSVHPGPGLPMAALSGRMAATRLMEDWASTHRSHPVAMRGGMSMP